MLPPRLRDARAASLVRAATSGLVRILAVAPLRFVIHSGGSWPSRPWRIWWSRRGPTQKRRLRRREEDIAKAAARTNLRAAGKLTQLVDGQRRFVRRPPVLERFGSPSKHTNAGKRVVTGQRLMQAPSDIFLSGTTRPASTENSGLLQPAVAGRQGLLRHHPDGAARAYLGSSDAFDRAIVRFAEAYADQTERDHAVLVRAIREKRLSALAGV